MYTYLLDNYLKYGEKREHNIMYTYESETHKSTTNIHGNLTKRSTLCANTQRTDDGDNED